MAQPSPAESYDASPVETQGLLTDPVFADTIIDTVRFTDQYRLSTGFGIYSSPEQTRIGGILSPSAEQIEAQRDGNWLGADTDSTRLLPGQARQAGALLVAIHTHVYPEDPALPAPLWPTTDDLQHFREMSGSRPGLLAGIAGRIPETHAGSMALLLFRWARGEKPPRWAVPASFNSWNTQRRRRHMEDIGLRVGRIALNDRTGTFDRAEQGRAMRQLYKP
jgi:hypothetical protein